MKKLLIYGFGMLAISALPAIAHAQFNLNAITAGVRPGYVYQVLPPTQIIVPPPVAQPIMRPPETFNGTSQTFGNTTSTQFQGSYGTSLNCTSQTFGNQTTTNCQ